MNLIELNWFKLSALFSGERTLRVPVCRGDGSWGCKLSPSNALPAPHSLCKVVLHGPQVLFSQNCLPLPELVMGVGVVLRCKLREVVCDGGLVSGGEECLVVRREFTEEASVSPCCPV